MLTARVLRLWLSGATPEESLCLTYTKAAAAEMTRADGELPFNFAMVIGHQLGRY